jgi:Macrocin-O-methyltransferase (TylF)
MTSLYTEQIRRMLNPAFLGSSVKNATLDLWDQFSHSEFSAIYRRVRPYTMVSNARLRALHRAARYVDDHSIEGDIVECGSASGGSAALLALSKCDISSTRIVWLFDTFEGMPPPSANDPDQLLAAQYVGTCRGEIDEVRAMLTQLGVADRCRLVKGLFQDTLPKTEVGKISLLHIDGDWYDSVMSCLTNLYDNVSTGGIIQIDDYGYWKGTRAAVTAFFHQRGLRQDLTYIDYAGRQFIKR